MADAEQGNALIDSNSLTAVQPSLYGTANFHNDAVSEQRGVSPYHAPWRLLMAMTMIAASVIVGVHYASTVSQTVASDITSLTSITESHSTINFCLRTFCSNQMGSLLVNTLLDPSIKFFPACIEDAGSDTAQGLSCFPAPSEDDILRQQKLDVHMCALCNECVIGTFPTSDSCESFMTEASSHLSVKKMGYNHQVVDLYRYDEEGLTDLKIHHNKHHKNSTKGHQGNSSSPTYHGNSTTSHKNKHSDHSSLFSMGHWEAKCWYLFWCEEETTPLPIPITVSTPTPAPTLAPTTAVKVTVTTVVP